MGGPAPIVSLLTIGGRKAKFCLSPGIRQLDDNRCKQGMTRGCYGGPASGAAVRQVQVNWDLVACE